MRHTKGAAGIMCGIVLAALATAPVHAATRSVQIRKVDTSQWPKVNATVSVRSPVRLSSGDFTVTANGRRVAATAEPLSATGRGVGVALVIDTSGSMQGGPLRSALSAARSFLRRLPTGSRVGIVTFSDRPHRLLDLTKNRSAAAAALRHVSASGETGLYDGVVAAAHMLAGSDQQRNIVLLSDGGDTTSKMSLARAIAAAGSEGATITAVGLKTGEADPGALKSLASSTGGRYSPASTADLGAVYNGIASDLRRQYVLNFPLSANASGPISLAVTTSAGTASAAVSAPANARQASSQQPATGQSRPAPQPGESFWAGTVGLALVLLLVFGAVFFFALLVFGHRATSERRERLASLVDATKITKSAGAKESPGGERGSARWIPESFVERARVLTEDRRLGRNLTEKIERAGVQWTPAEVVAGAVFLACLGFIAGGLLLRNPLVALGLTLVGGCLPFIMLALKQRKRIAKLHDQLVDVLLIMATALRSGHSFIQALDLVSKEIDAPAAQEFSRVVAEVRLGRDIDDSLNALADRVGSDDFRWAVLAVNIQRQVGGNLAEVLDTIAETLKEREAVSRQVDVLTTEGKMSMWILTGLPFLVFGWMSWVNPAYIGLLFKSSIGILMVVTAGCLLAVGFVWMRKIVKIDV